MQSTETTGRHPEEQLQEQELSGRKSRNPVIELARFVFMIMILFWHARNYHSGGNPVFCGKMGYIAVEFFFLVSGYLIAAKAWKEREQPYTGTDTLRFLGGKLKSLLPVYIIALIGGIVSTIILDKLGFKEAIQQLLLSVYDVALLRISGIYIVQFVPGTWYVSAMLIGGIILYSLHRRFGDVFSYLIAPVGAILLLGFLFKNYTDLNVVTGKFKTFAPGLLRALAEMSAGCVVFRITAWLKEKRLTLFSSACLSLINAVCIAIAFIGATKVLHKRFDYIMLVLLAVSVTIMFSEQSLYFRCRKKAVDSVMIWLGKISLPMYLTHMWIKAIITATTKGWPRQTGLILFFGSVIAFSVFSLWLAGAWKAFMLKNGSKVRRIFIQETPQE